MEKHEREKVWSDFRVGLMTLLSVCLIITLATFAGGDKGILFKKTSTVKAYLTNVGGLKRGCSVAMSGMTIGHVTDISFIGASQVNQVEVTMQVRSDLRNRIKVDSTPSIRTQGMLGDRYLDISMGGPNAEILPQEQPLIGKAATDFDETLHKAVDVMTETDQLLSKINEGEGTVGRLIYTDSFYSRAMNLMDEFEQLIKDFKKQPRRYVKLSIF